MDINPARSHLLIDLTCPHCQKKTRSQLPAIRRDIITMNRSCGAPTVESPGVCGCPAQYTLDPSRNEELLARSSSCASFFLRLPEQDCN
jgi:hypothetical protein